MSKAAELAALIGSGQAQGNKNLIINGAMQVAQRGTSETGITSQGYHTVDRFRTAYSNIADELIVTEEQDTNAPAGFGNSFKLTVTTPETSLASDERLRLVQRIEGQNLQRLKYGTSSAEYVTLSFYVKSNVTGTYGVQLDNRNDTRSVSASYTINSANTWERKTVSFAGDTTGSFDNDNARSLDVCWYLAAGTGYTSGTFATSWESRTDANIAPSGQENLMSTANNFWAVTGVSLEVGDVATPFEHESYGETLQKCHRYFQRHDNVSGVTLQCYNTTDAYTFIQYPDGRMRASATATVNYSSGDTIAVAGSGKTISAREFTGSNRPNGATFKVTASGLTAGYAAHYDKDASNIWQFDAEL